MLIFLLAYAVTGKSEEITIALGNFPPLFSTAEDPALFKDLIDGVYQYLPEKKVSYRYMVPNARLVMELNMKTVDGSANIFSRKEIDGCLTQPIFSYSDGAFSKKSQQLTIESIEDLTNLKVVSYQRATTLLGEKYKKIVSNNDYYNEVAQPEDQAKFLATGLVDVSVGDKYIFLQSLKTWSEGKYDVNDFVFHPIFPPVASSIGFNKQAHCDEFDQALIKFKASGEYQAVYKNHLTRLGYKK